MQTIVQFNVSFMLAIKHSSNNDIKIPSSLVILSINEINIGISLICLDLQLLMEFTKLS